MKAELIAVGTEILLGEITDTNTPFIARELANLGIETYFQSTVGDNPERLQATIEIAAKRSDLVILSGGLGPTKDDLTKQTVAKYVHEELVIDPKAMAKIERYYAETNRTMTANNRIQAMYFKDSRALTNRTGFAVGIFYQQAQGPDFLLLPGPPSEFEPMVSEQVVPLLQRTYFNDQLLRSRVLRFFGIGESQLTTDLSALIVNQTNPTVAPYAKTNEVTLRLTAKAANEMEAQRLLDGLEAQIQKIAGAYFYGYGEDNSLAKVVTRKLQERKLTISTIEGYTAGLLAADLSNARPDDTILSGGQVVTKLTSTPQKNLTSKEETIALAKQIQTKTRSDWAIAIALPTVENTTTGEKIGHVWLALSDRQQQVTTQLVTFSTIRSFTKQRLVMDALSLINRVLK
ncbi:competence/damage-inducible protein A [Pediococcus siamensis]|uniref:competence/damage-inducible protein A n=1 Tax=Pediococcus siamensis TaxID=381829 RepID=UPI0039A20481